MVVKIMTENTDKILNTKYRPKEQEVRTCLKWLFSSKYIQYGEECWMDKDKEDYEKGSSEGNIADIVFTDSVVFSVEHVCTADQNRFDVVVFRP